MAMIEEFHQRDLRSVVSPRMQQPTTFFKYIEGAGIDELLRGEEEVRGTSWWRNNCGVGGWTCQPLESPNPEENTEKLVVTAVLVAIIVVIAAGGAGRQPS
ncbi:hypothetical protein X777_10716 [Ooceraea biroi]|uniref:Uncharacterized protein n=1 Tax=Ooceraea biroi TaxID=2015173 RepID=A0A026W3C1_OOCBI|nr:hypothetical protein X777_10716 [Ooceraea biroi]